MEEKKKSLLKYAGEISSPVIKQDDIKKWESDAVKTVNDHFAQKFNEIKNEYSKLIDEFNGMILFISQIILLNLFKVKHIIYIKKMMRKNLFFYLLLVQMSGICFI